MNPTERVRLGRTPLTVTRLGLGTAPLGGLFQAVDDAKAEETLARAYSLGLRYFDTAPLYGYGLAEKRLGRALRGKLRDDLVVSTKVGRLLRPDAPPDLTQFHGGEPFYKGTPAVNPVFEFSYGGVMRSLEESLRRLHLDRVDVLYIHDPDDHHQEALEGAYRALEELRRGGMVAAIGVGMNTCADLVRFAHEADFDCFLVAGRYTLLDQAALHELLPLCLKRGIGVIVGGVFNSGILADPRPGARFDYVPASPSRVERALQLDAVCRRWGVPLKAAAIQFPFGHPAVTAALVGCRSAAEVEENEAMFRMPIPAEMWREMASEGLLPDEAVPVR